MKNEEEPPKQAQQGGQIIEGEIKDKTHTKT
jgi:hypothetical protein